MNFEIEYGNSRKSMADLNLFAIRRKRLNQGRDILCFSEHLAGTLEKPPLVSALERVKFYRDGQPFFEGTLAKIRTEAKCNSHFRTYEVWGPFWDLESIIYQQLWRSFANSNSKDGSLQESYRSHIILGQKVDGTQLTLSEQLHDILHYAKNAGANFQVGDFNFPQTLPLEECRDISCAEAIQRLLRWVPDATAYFDYGTVPATLRIRRHGELDVFPLAGTEDLASLSLTPRHDLQLQGVAIKYERNHSVDGKLWQTMEVDSFPENRSEQSPRFAIFTVELEGSKSVYLKQKIEAEPIHPESPIWWKKHLPALHNVPDSAISVLSHGRESKLPNELIRGCIADWMPVRGEMDRVSARLAYRLETETIVEQTVSISLCATDAVSETYGQMSDFRPQESTPKGLAQVFFESFSEPCCEGECLFESTEIMEASLGQKIFCESLSPDFAGFRASIQEIDEEIDAGKVRLRFGHPTHLGLRNLVELARMNRRREAPIHSAGRSSGSGTNSLVEQPIYVPQKSIHVAQTSYEKMIFTTPDKSRRIVLDAATIPQTDLVLQVGEEYVCENGVLKRRLALFSQAYEEGPVAGESHA